jgi:Family of unknown function (DUF5652)
MLYNPIFRGLGLSMGIMMLLLVLILWESVWKGIGLWKSGKNKQLGWFICIFIFNTLGILPIIYLWFFQKKTERRVTRKRSRSRRR